MRAFIEPKVVILRVGQDGALLGDDFTWSCVADLSFLRKEAELHAVAGRAPTPTEWRAINDLLAELGIETAVWERRAEGERRLIVRRKVRKGSLHD